MKTGDPNGAGLPAWSTSTRVNNGAYMWFAEKLTGTTSGLPYFGTTAERRNALLHEYEMKFYGVNW